MKVALFGAGGAVGSVLAPELARQGVSVRLVGRQAQRLTPLAAASPGSEIVEADLADASSARRAASGVDSIVYLVGQPYTKFHLHPLVTRTVVEAAEASGVERLLHVSTVYPYGRPQTTPVTEAHPLTPHTRKGRYRLEQEQIVQEAHGRGQLRTTILRAPDFYGPTAELSFVREIFTAAIAGKAATVVGPIDTPHEFLYIPDIAAVIATMLTTDAVWGKAFNLAGAGTITTRELGDLAFAAAGTKPRYRVAGILLIRALGLFDPFMREVAEMHYLFTTPIILGDTLLRETIGPIVKTPYPHGVRQTIEELRSPGEKGLL